MPANARRNGGGSSPPSPTDSVDLEGLPVSTQICSPGWLDAVGPNHASPGSAPRVISPSLAKDSVNTTATNPPHHTQTYTPKDGSPSTAHYSSDATAMGSPIPVAHDDSDNNIRDLISSIGARGDVRGAPSSSGPVAATSVPQAMSPPQPRPLTQAPMPQPSTAAKYMNPSASMARPLSRSSFVSPSLSPATQPPPRVGRRALDSYASSASVPVDFSGDFQHSPFGDSHNATTSVGRTTFPQYSDMQDTTVATDAFPTPTSYSSALMQALSRSEGAAVANSQWTSTTHASGSYGDANGEAPQGDDGAEDDTDSSEYPTDIYEEAMRAKVAKQQWMALERARQGVLEEARRRRDCPFAPTVSPYAARLRRPASLRPENRVTTEVIRRRQWLAKKQQQEVERELRECTFRPLTVRAAQLDPAALRPAGPQVFDNLYAEAEERRTFETEVKPQLVLQAESRRRPSPSPMRPGQLAEVVERLCARSVVRASVSAHPERGKDNGEGSQAEAGNGAENALGDDPYRDAIPVPNGKDHGAVQSTPPDTLHQPVLSSMSQRIVAAQVAAGERDRDVVRHLYRQAERDMLKDQLKVELQEEQERLARAEQAMVLAQERTRLQQEHCRSVVAAKFRVLAKHAAATHHTSYRVTAAQSVVHLARATLDLLSPEEAEELLGALEHCGRQRLKEAEFIAVIFQHFAEKQTAPTASALLTCAPPAAATAKRAGSSGAGGGLAGGTSVESSPTGLPQVKREKPDPELIAQAREKRAMELEEWKQQHLRQRAIAEGQLVDEGCSFQPAPRRLIPYECRPDVTIPVKTTKSEALRRAYITTRLQGTTGLLAPVTGLLPEPTTSTPSTAVPSAPKHTSSIARKLFSRLPPTEEGRKDTGAFARVGSPSEPAAAGMGSRRESSAASVQPPSPLRSAGAPSGSGAVRGPSRSPPTPPQLLKPSLLRTTSAAAAPAPAGSASSPGASTRARAPHAKPVPPPQAPSSSAFDRTDAVAAFMPGESARPSSVSTRATQPSASRSQGVSDTASLMEQVINSAPEDRARLGRALLMRQLRDHQRRRPV